MISTTRISEHLHRNAWLLTAMGICVLACLLLGSTAPREETREEHISRVLSGMAGAGDTEVAIYYDAQSVPCGAVVLSGGAADIGVRLQLTDAVSTLLGLDPSAVAVYPLEGGAR